MPWDCPQDCIEDADGLLYPTGGVYARVFIVMQNVFTELAVSPPLQAPVPSCLQKRLNRRLKMDGLKLLGDIADGCIAAAFFDPQYRGILDKLCYGNEGASRGKRRSDLRQMTKDEIAAFIGEIARTLKPSGHVFLWVDKYELLNGFRHWLEGSALHVVDLIGWDKCRMGMGYRTRRVTEYCLVLQKPPLRAKGVWTSHTIRDTWQEKVDTSGHPHRKPIGLQTALMEAVTHEGDIILDPAAGDFTVLEAAGACGRNFIGCDIAG